MTGVGGRNGFALASRGDEGRRDKDQHDGVEKVRVGVKDGGASGGNHIGVSAWFCGIDVVNEESVEFLLSRVGCLAAQMVE